MTKEEARKLRNGVYRLYWKGGGGDRAHSVASVGRLYDGAVWFMPANWVWQNFVVSSTEWSIVERVELIEESPH